ncbi:hypothetical protein KAJ27_10980 [bacterium]|nr:hypothetical protein [bacterium]
MNFFKVLLVFVLLFTTTFAFAGSIREIVMTDGSIITGEIISINDGECIIKSASLGKLTIDSDKIETIRKKGSKSKTAADSLTEYGKTYDTTVTSQGNKMKTSAGINSLKSSLMSDPDSLGAIMSVQNDPDMQAVLNDPNVMNLIKSGNVDSLMTNPKIIQLMNNPAINNIKNKVSK